MKATHRNEFPMFILWPSHFPRGEAFFAFPEDWAIRSQWMSMGDKNVPSLLDMKVYSFWWTQMLKSWENQTAIHRLGTVSISWVINVLNEALISLLDIRRDRFDGPHSNRCGLCLRLRKLCSVGALSHCPINTPKTTRVPRGLWMASVLRTESKRLLEKVFVILCNFHDFVLDDLMILPGFRGGADGD